MGKRDAIRQRVFTGGSPKLNQELGNLARDASNAFAELTGLALVEFPALYTEPLYVGFDHEPKGCVLIRVREVAALETPIVCGGVIPFVWEQQATRLRVASIDGLTPGTGPYRFTFLMVA